MNRIRYDNPDILKKDYLNILNSHELQEKWAKVRSEIIEQGGYAIVYPEELSDILVGDFELLSKIFFDYKRIKCDLTTTLRKNVSNIFNYSGSKRLKIVEFFKHHAHQLGISTCCYCDMSYINVYSSSAGKKQSHFDLDHFLPRSKCPITALSLFNFIPCCPVCNQRLKKDYFWAVSEADAIMLSPSSSSYDYDGKVRFLLLPLKTYRIINCQDNPEYFQLILSTSSPIYNKLNAKLCLEERYDFHKCEALRLLDLMRDYPPAHIKMIKNVLGSNGISFSEKKITEDIFGSTFKQKHKRTFGKLTSDIMKLYK